MVTSMREAIAGFPSTNWPRCLQPIPRGPMVRRRGAADGLLIGFTLGALLGGGLAALGHCKEGQELCVSGWVIFPPVGAVLFGLIGAIVGALEGHQNDVQLKNSAADFDQQPLR